VVQLAARLTSPLQFDTYSHRLANLHCADADLPLGLVQSRRLQKRLTYDAVAPTLTYAVKYSGEGIVVAERNSDVSDIIAANYALAIGTDFQLVEPFDHRDSSRINHLLVDWVL